jgi:hypothetical protein
MNEEKQLTQHESFSIIQQMLDQAKNEQKDDGKGWIVWGWMLFVVSILSALNVEFKWVSNIFIFWNAFGIITVLYFIFETVRYFFFKRTEKVKTYTGDLFKKLNIGFFISLLFIITSINVGTQVIFHALKPFEETLNEGNAFSKVIYTPINIGFASLMSVYAFWILIYGTALNFKPSVIGAYITWAIGFTAMFINRFQYVMLLQALAVLCGYIIPGYLANRQFKRVQRKEIV